MFNFTERNRQSFAGKCNRLAYVSSRPSPCAAIANVYWNYRMFLATGDSKYVDVLERALYNGVIFV